MRCLARTSLGMLGLALIAPMGVNAQDATSSAPAGYQPASAVAAQPPMGLDGNPLPPPSDPTTPPPAASRSTAKPPMVHTHDGRTLCARCAAKEKAVVNAMPPGKIVGCAHSKNGVCTACQAALNMPGKFVVMGSPESAPVAEAPGRAVASRGRLASSAVMAAKPGRAAASSPYDGPSGDPTPVGVVQANFTPAGPSGQPAAPSGPASQPGRAVAELTSGHDPYQAKSGGFPHPHILGHLFGWSGLGGERADEKARRKAETHAMIRYEDGSPTTPIEDLPASVVYGKRNR